MGLPPGPTALARLGHAVRRGLNRTPVKGQVVEVSDVTLGRATLAAGLGWLVLPSIMGGGRLGMHVLGAVAGGIAVVHSDRARRQGAGAAALPELPAVLDRLAMCVLSGLSIEASLRSVAPGAPLPLRDAFLGAIAVLDAGGSRRDAYRRMAIVVPSDELSTLAASLERSERLGVSVADTIVVQARECRSRARAIAEGQIAAAPVKLVFPLVFCFLPAFVVLAVGPVAISAIRTLSTL